MRPFLLTSLAAAALVALAGCASAPDVRVDRDPGTDLKQYRTFGYHERAGTDGGRYASLLTQHLKTATRRHLERQGYTYSEHDPDLRVHFLLNIDERIDVRSLPATVGVHGYRGWGGGVQTTHYRQGTLAIDLVDARRAALVWRGVAEGRLDADAAQAPAGSVDAAVGQIFAAFPDGAKR